MNAVKSHNSGAERRWVQRVGQVFGMAAFLGLSSLGSAHAAKFGVRVVDDLGKPVAGASVCIGLEGNYKQFGAMFTGADGNAIVEVPNVPLVVTVSKTRFAGTRMIEPARDFTLIREVKLVEGRPGPRCRAGSTLAANPPEIYISDIAVRRGARTASLTPSVSGEPSHYRVSNLEDFSNANWQRFDTSINLPASLFNEPSLFLQMRRFTGSSRAWLESVSDVVTVYMPIAN